MTLKEFYESIGSDYNAVVTRLGGSEKMVDKFVRKFPNDNSEQQLIEAIESKDYQLAFRMAHTLKGVCANLGLDRLQKASSELTEALRDHVADNTNELLQTVKTEYDAIMSGLEKLD